MARTRPMIERGGSIDGIVSDSLSEIESLKDEMQEWADSLSSNNMEHLPKYDEVTECIDALENAISNIPDMPDLLPEMKDEVKWQEKAPYKGVPSRSTRLNNATNDITQVIDYIESFLADFEDENEEYADLVQEWESYKDDLQNIVDEADSVSFPGMFG